MAMMVCSMVQMEEIIAQLVRLYHTDLLTTDQLIHWIWESGHHDERLIRDCPKDQIDYQTSL